MVAPGAPVTFTVAIAGSGFKEEESRSTQVKLQAGDHSASQSLSLAALKDQGGSQAFHFALTFDPGDLGDQTATATVDPGDALGTKSQETLDLTVALPYKLRLIVNGVPVQDSGDALTLRPSVEACGRLPRSTPGAVEVKLQCINTADSSLSMFGCQNFILDLSPGPDDGGHRHNSFDETRPFVFAASADRFPVGSFQPFISTGEVRLTYTPPEVAGDVYFQMVGKDQLGNVITGPNFLFRVRDTSLGDMKDLNGVGAGDGPDGINPGISVAATSHPGAGSYGTEQMLGAVRKMVARYYKNGNDGGYTDLDPLASQAGSMLYGGVFDANWSADIYPFPTPWDPPHCSHRNGATIDLSIRQLDSDERQWLRNAAANAGFNFTAVGERPEDPSANHWHAVLGGGL